MKYQYSVEDAYKILEYISAEYKDKGKEIDVKFCPICHGGDNKDQHTFSINRETGLCNCLRGSCNFKGNLVQLARELDYPLIVQEEKFRSFSSRTKIRTSNRAIKYLNGRGISTEVIEKYKITSNDSGDIAFPFYDEYGKLTFIKYRSLNPNSKSKEYTEKNCKPILFGMNHATEYDKPLVITEGQIDALSLAEAGISNPVSVPMGKNGWKWLNFCEKYLQKFKEIIVFGDNENGIITLAGRLNEEYKGKIKVVREVDYLGEKDANDILKFYGAAELRRAVENAKPYMSENRDYLDEIEVVDYDSLPKIRTYIAEIDRLLVGFTPGQLVLLTGKSGEGKSTFGSQLTVNALRQGYNSYIYSGELESWQVQRWVDFQIAGSKHTITKTIESKEYRVPDIETYSIADSDLKLIHWWYHGRCLIYNNTDKPADISEQDYLLESMRQAALYDDCKFFLIDNIMTVVNEIDKNKTANEMQTAFAKELKSFARKYNVVVLLVSHRKKSNGQRSSDDNDFVYGSSNIVNLSDTVMTYARANEEDHQGELIITKNRAYGKITKEKQPVKLYFNEASKRIASSQADEERTELSWTQGVRPTSPDLSEAKNDDD